MAVLNENFFSYYKWCNYRSSFAIKKPPDANTYKARASFDFKQFTCKSFLSVKTRFKSLWALKRVRRVSPQDLESRNTSCYCTDEQKNCDSLSIPVYHVETTPFSLAPLTYMGIFTGNLWDFYKFP